MNYPRGSKLFDSEHNQFRVALLVYEKAIILILRFCILANTVGKTNKKANMFLKGKDLYQTQPKRSIYHVSL